MYYRMPKLKFYGVIKEYNLLLLKFPTNSHKYDLPSTARSRSRTLTQKLKRSYCSLDVVVMIPEMTELAVWGAVLFCSQETSVLIFQHDGALRKNTHAG
jgi:hypothetical protein